jgi:hypothetical protein
MAEEGLSPKEATIKSMTKSPALLVGIVIVRRFCSDGFFALN